MNTLHDVAAHDPRTGELLKMYRGVSYERLEAYYVLLYRECPDAEVTEREYEPEDGDPMDIPEYLKRDPAV